MGKKIMLGLDLDLPEHELPEKVKPVMVVGAGIAGIQAALDLSKAGVPVIIVEKKSSIGGIMAALDKTFPTMDCSICIEAPVMSEMINNPNVTTKTLTEVIGVEGVAGDFTVTLKSKQSGGCTPQFGVFIIADIQTIIKRSI